MFCKNCVLFTDSAQSLKDMSKIKISIWETELHIATGNIEYRGSTHLTNGTQIASIQYRKFAESMNGWCSNRDIFRQSVHLSHIRLVDSFVSVGVLNAFSNLDPLLPNTVVKQHLYRYSILLTLLIII